MPDYDLEKLDDYRWQIPQTGGMRVPARLYASEAMLEDILSDDAPQQAANVAHMPGIVTASLAMPDIHWGYGFPIGGVAAFDPDDGVISPGGVGYDINCLSGDSRVLHTHGYTRSIAEMETTWRGETLRCHDFDAPSSDDTAVAACDDCQDLPDGFPCAACFIAGRAADVVIDGEVAGVIGELHPAVLRAHDLEVPVAAFEFRLDAL